MKVATPLSIATLADAPCKNVQLADLVISTGHRLLGQWILSESARDPLPKAAAWLVDTNGDIDDARLDSLLEDPTSTVLFCDTHAAGEPYTSYSQNPIYHGIRQRLTHIGAELALKRETQANYMCLIGASTGGLEPVKKFLSVLPKDLDVAFIYAQHIDPQQIKPLAQSLKSTEFEPTIAEHHLVLTAGKIVIASPDQNFVVQKNGTLSMTAEIPWRGLYSPSISQLGFNLANIYKDRFSMIIFSGMDDDGSQAAHYIRRMGGTLFAQTPSLATSPSMPEACIRTGHVSVIGSPEALAQAFQSKYYHAHAVTTYRPKSHQ